MRTPPAILILAAGASTRMRGDDKLLQSVAGTPLILQIARAACAACADVSIVLPSADRTRRAWLGDTPARLIDIDALAMSASISAGVAMCRADAVMIVLADMPEITTNDLTALILAWQGSRASIMRAASADGTPGQPVIFDRSLFPELVALTGDEGARSVIRTHGAESIRLPGRRALIDLDTPEDWAEWRAKTKTDL